MKLLLTSAGIKNPSIHNALVELLGKPTTECDALCIPTALYGHPHAGPRQAWRCISGEETGTPTVGVGWKSMGVLELTALPSLDAEQWIPLVRETDVLLVEGGDATYLCHWMRQSGLADLLATLPDMVWVGVSAGSMVMTPRIGDDFVRWPSAPDDRTLGIDATLRYGLGIPGTRPLTKAHLASNSPYNTRRFRGLPPTPIGNPGLASIRAAANPAGVDYLYYVRKPDKIHHFFTADDEEFCRKAVEYGYSC